MPNITLGRSVAMKTDGSSYRDREDRLCSSRGKRRQITAPRKNDCGPLTTLKKNDCGPFTTIKKNDFGPITTIKKSREYNLKYVFSFLKAYFKLKFKKCLYKIAQNHILFLLVQYHFAPIFHLNILINI